MAGPPRRGDARGEPAAVEQVAGILGHSHQRLRVGGKRDRPVHPGPDAGFAGDRDPVPGSLGDRREPLMVGREQLGPQIPGDGPPRGAGAVLPPADGQAAGLRLDVEPAVGIAERGKVTGQAGDLVGDDVLVLDGADGNVRAG